MNVINVIEPYRHLEMWVFDDPSVGLSQEQFVGGVDTMIDRVTADVTNADKGFVMVFSAIPFTGSQFRLEWRREDGSGNVYYSAELDAEGWLCPAQHRYFEKRPPEIQFRSRRSAPRADRVSASTVE